MFMREPKQLAGSLHSQLLIIEGSLTNTITGIVITEKENLTSNSICIILYTTEFCFATNSTDWGLEKCKFV